MAGAARIRIDDAPVRPDRLRLQVLASLAAGPATSTNTTTNTTATSNTARTTSPQPSTDQQPAGVEGDASHDNEKQRLRTAAAAVAPSSVAEDEDVEANRIQKHDSPTGSLGFDIEGVYHTRSYAGALPRTASPYPRNRKSRLRREEARIQHSDAAAAADPEDGEDWRRDDGKKKQVFRGRALLWLAYQSVGVIYGDIGTR